MDFFCLPVLDFLLYLPIPVYRIILDFFCLHLPTYIRLPVCLYFEFSLISVCMCEVWISTYRGGCLLGSPPTTVSTYLYFGFSLPFCIFSLKIFSACIFVFFQFVCFLYFLYLWLFSAYLPWSAFLVVLSRLSFGTSVGWSSSGTSMWSSSRTGAGSSATRIALFLLLVVPIARVRSTIGYSSKDGAACSISLTNSLREYGSPSISNAIFWVFRYVCLP